MQSQSDLLDQLEKLLDEELPEGSLFRWLREVRRYDSARRCLCSYFELCARDDPVLKRNDMLEEYVYMRYPRIRDIPFDTLFQELLEARPNGRYELIFKLEQVYEYFRDAWLSSRQDPLVVR